MYIDYLQVRRSSAIIYSLWVGPRYSHPVPAHLDRARAGAYSGDMSAGSIRRLRRTVDVLLQVSPFRRIYNPVSKTYHDFTVSFITLTISDERIRPHREVMKKCLEPFLRWLRSQGAKSYIWKAELQDRGQIHYHLTINEFVHWERIQNQWNRLQKRAGYLDKFARANGHFRPNSTDIHAVKNVRDLESYLCKYVLKSVTKDASRQRAAMLLFEAGMHYLPPAPRIDGKVWDCSQNLKTGYFSTELTAENVARCRQVGLVQKEQFAMCKYGQLGEVKILEAWQMAQLKTWKKAIAK